jgi:hypothetical protein
MLWGTCCLHLRSISTLKKEAAGSSKILALMYKQIKMATTLTRCAREERGETVRETTLDGLISSAVCFPHHAICSVLSSVFSFCASKERPLPDRS